MFYVKATLIAPLSSSKSQGLTSMSLPDFEAADRWLSDLVSGLVAAGWTRNHNVMHGELTVCLLTAPVARKKEPGNRCFIEISIEPCMPHFESTEAAKSRLLSLFQA